MLWPALAGLRFLIPFNEAEARAPRMPPPYRPLDSKAILPRFRTVVHSDGQSLPNSTCDRIEHVKEPCDSNTLPRFEGAWGSACHTAARKCPAGTKHV